MEATIAQAAWGRLFRAAMDVIAGCFARPETRATAAEMITGLLAEVDTRNCWTLAEALGHPGPHRLQHLLSRATFDHDRAREQIARLVVHELAGQDVVLVADDTGDAKSSTGCVGAGRQYSGAIKGVGLCQVAVHLAAVTESVRVVIDRALYLPKAWAADEERREATGVPEVIMFATKLQQTAAMVKNALELGVQARWFVGDEVSSGRELRMKLREFGLGYAVGVSHASTVTDGACRRWKARQMINKVLSHQWMRMQTGHGTKGTREHDWAWLDIRADDTPDGHPDGVGVLVARRHRYTGETSFYRCWSPGNVTLAGLVEVICRRWRIEETFQLGKTFTGLDEGQVTCWNSWMRWSLFSLIASAVLALTAAATTTLAPARPARLVPLTCPELVRFLRAFVPHTTGPGGPPRPALDDLAPPSSGHRPSLPPAPTRSPGPAMTRTTAAVSEDEGAEQRRRPASAAQQCGNAEQGERGRGLMLVGALAPALLATAFGPMGSSNGVVHRGWGSCPQVGSFVGVLVSLTKRRSLLVSASRTDRSTFPWADRGGSCSPPRVKGNVHASTVPRAPGCCLRRRHRRCRRPYSGAGAGADPLAGRHR